MILKKSLQNIKKIIEKNIDVIIISLLLLFIIIFSTKICVENFSKQKRYMWMYSPSSRNSSYDQRGEPIHIVKDVTKIGKFYESSLDSNETNQRVRV